MFPQGRPGLQTLHTHLLSSLPLGPRQPLSGRKRRSAWTPQLPRDPGVPREQRTHLCCCKTETAGRLRLPCPQVPSSLQAQVCCHPDPWSPSGEAPTPPVPHLCLGLGKGAVQGSLFVSLPLQMCQLPGAPGHQRTQLVPLAIGMGGEETYCGPHGPWGSSLAVAAPGPRSTLEALRRWEVVFGGCPPGLASPSECPHPGPRSDSSACPQPRTS